MTPSAVASAARALIERCGLTESDVRDRGVHLIRVDEWMAATIKGTVMDEDWFTPGELWLAQASLTPGDQYLVRADTLLLLALPTEMASEAAIALLLAVVRQIDNPHPG